ncbi:hypothetical protein B0H19DRAFT_1065793 [Mycena capillaripes]|nr:hypothetical protein B0H19DRAFT_1065793 [Mycena capillaripes]
MSSLAVFCDVPISAVFDPNATTTSVSLDWVVNSGLRTLNSQASGLLMLPSNLGDFPMHLNVCVAASLPADLVLGLDWLRFVCGTTPAHGMVVGLSSGLLELQHDSETAPPTIGSSTATTVVGAVTLSVPSVSFSGPGGVSPPSSAHCTRGVDVVAACTLAAPPRQELANRMLTPYLSAPLDDPFVCLSVQDKTDVINFLVTNRRHICPREPGVKRKSASTLRDEFLVHQCTEACLILGSEAMVAGFNGTALSPDKLRECALILNLTPKSIKRKPQSLRESPPTKVARLSFEETTPGLNFPVMLPQSEKDEIVLRVVRISVRAGRSQVSKVGKPSNRWRPGDQGSPQWTSTEDFGNPGSDVDGQCACGICANGESEMS